MRFGFVRKLRYLTDIIIIDIEFGDNSRENREFTKTFKFEKRASEGLQQRLGETKVS